MKTHLNIYFPQCEGYSSKNNYNIYREKQKNMKKQQQQLQKSYFLNTSSKKTTKIISCKYIHIDLRQYCINVRLQNIKKKENNNKWRKYLAAAT